MRWFRTASVSMPSATAVEPGLRARSIVGGTIAFCARGSSRMSVMNERSILISVAGSRARYLDRGVACPEVIDRRRRRRWYAKRSSTATALCGSAIAGALGDLHDEPVPVSDAVAVAGSRRRAAGSCVVEQVKGGQVDRHLKHRFQGARQVTSCPGAWSIKCQRERSDQSGLLDQRNELCWCEQRRVNGIMSAHQGLDAE